MWALWGASRGKCRLRNRQYQPFEKVNYPRAGPSSSEYRHRALWMASFRLHLGFWRMYSASWAYSQGSIALRPPSLCFISSRLHHRDRFFGWMPCSLALALRTVFILYPVASAWSLISCTRFLLNSTLQDLQVRLPGSPSSIFTQGSVSKGASTLTSLNGLGKMDDYLNTGRFPELCSWFYLCVAMSERMSLAAKSEISWVSWVSCRLVSIWGQDLIFGMAYNPLLTPNTIYKLSRERSLAIILFIQIAGMAEEGESGFPWHSLRDFMQKHRELTIEQCLREFNHSLKEKVDLTFETNVENVKKYFDAEVKAKAQSPTTFNELTSKAQ